MRYNLSIKSTDRSKIVQQEFIQMNTRLFDSNVVPRPVLQR